MEVHRWFDSFAAGHIARNHRDDWPDPEHSPEFWDAWRFNFVKAGLLDPAVATEASQRMAAENIRFLADHLPRLIALAMEIYKGRAACGHGGAAESRESAAVASKSCPDCRGLGLAVRYRHLPADAAAGPTVTLYCLCPLGRWIERSHRVAAADIRKRIPDLADHPFLWIGPVDWSDEDDNRHRYPRAAWDGFNDRPMPVGADRLPSSFVAALARKVAVQAATPPF